MPHIDLVDATIIRHAHEFVTTWRRAHKRRPFAEAVQSAERTLWGALPESDLQRKAFRHVANAIRVGYGHIETNPKPLLEIVRRVLPR